MLDKKGFIFNRTNKLSKKIVLYLSHINICYYLNLPLPIMPGECFRKVSQEPKSVNIFFDDVDKDFHCECRQWCLSNSQSK